MEDKELVETSDFIKLGQELQQDEKFLSVSEELAIQGKYRIILDREEKEPYLVRYYLYNYRPFARIVIHNILRSDIDGLHDHPWAFQTYILSGGYWEHTPEGRFWRDPGYHGVNAANNFHQLEIDPDADEQTWTLFLMGPKEKDWGFMNKDGIWIPHEIYLEERKNNSI